MPRPRTRISAHSPTAIFIGSALLVSVCVTVFPLPSSHTSRSTSLAILNTSATSVRLSPDAAFTTTRSRLINQPGSFAATDLVSFSPELAISAALAEQDEILRQRLLTAALRRWAHLSPDAAANWALLRPLGERSSDIGTILTTATDDDPSFALRLAARLVRDDPALAHDHGCSFVFALARHGDFSTAATFAGQGADDLREAWLSTAFSLWTEYQPQTAYAAAFALPDSADREAAALAVLTRWATLDPHSLADFARCLPSENARRVALNSAFAEWTSQDLVAASAWLNQLEPSPDFDASVAAVATQSPLITYRPRTAITWAESIFDPTLRIHILTRIVSEWAKTERTAAQTYAETSPAIAASERPSLINSLGQLSDR